jgi:hypothetical protein
MEDINFVITKEELDNVLNIQENKDIIRNCVINEIVFSQQGLCEITHLKQHGYDEIYTDISGYELSKKLKIFKGSKIKEFRRNNHLSLEFIEDDKYYSFEDLNNIKINFKVSLEKIKEKEKEVIFYV